MITKTTKKENTSILVHSSFARCPNNPIPQKSMFTKVSSKLYCAIKKKEFRKRTALTIHILM